jgi:type II secretory pathway pseudopilin PulG
MKASSRAGFTIIETLLVLGVTAALVAGILYGIGSSLNNQRYRDAVETLKTSLQTQFSELSSVQNDRDNTWSCSASGQVSDTTAETRGQSNCILLGKLVSLTGTDMIIHSVVGSKKDIPAAANDIDSLKNNYTLGVSTIIVEKRKLEWGTGVAWPIRVAGSATSGGTDPRQLSLMFIRSPDSGHIYTFSSDSTSDTPSSSALNAMISSVSGQPERIICVDPRGLNPPERVAVVIAGNASASGAIETKSNTLLASGGSEC